MAKLEWKGTPRLEKKEDIEVLLIGDSIIQRINCEQFKNTTWFYSYPGLDMEKIRHELENKVILPPPSKIGVVYVNVGTDEITYLQKTNQEPTSKIFSPNLIGVISVVRKLYRGSIVLCGSILPRLDDWNPRLREINLLTKEFVANANSNQLQFVDMWLMFEDKVDLYRQKTDYTRNDCRREDTRSSKVHLNEKGALLFQRELKRHIETAVDLKFMQKDKFPVPMTPEEWMRFRKMTRSSNIEPLFKITNYPEGANRDDQLIPYNGPQLSTQIDESEKDSTSETLYCHGKEKFKERKSAKSKKLKHRKRTSSESTGDAQTTRSTRSLRQLKDLISRGTILNLNNLVNYGCWCGERAMKSGDPKDPIDKACHLHYRCTQCLSLDYGNCDPNREFYKGPEMVATSPTQYRCRPNSSRCKEDLCECDVAFANALSLAQESFNASMINLRPSECRAPQMGIGKRSNPFGDFNGHASMLINTSAFQCCGEYPMRFPYMKTSTVACCGPKTYNPKVLDCCESNIIRAVGSCF
ncbi:Oidioi.mRNA.OKI2018_I69.chr2.g7802.t1.cds [Oikopleura dioica]|uniref:Oidioi.mRNA.OKI2018_I69.chr2.g7802.t1.cds n=1 Tax=Oikopleura dioica TaxID=34765 RepID=A0ABN7TBY2_OIKDI|nr:Oidioi.mRNA.OKI2018_I69.chr2.g7802.t1.cds [Oikopleura dioica]